MIVKISIIYTKDIEINDYSEYILYDISYDGMLDCINSSFRLLTNGRTSKEKVSILTSGSTGPAILNSNSKVVSINRMYGSLSIICPSYTILDFQDNIIYVDNSVDYIDNSGKKYNIGALIDIERSIEYVTICNLNIIGIYSYGIYVAGCSNLLK